MTDAPDTSPETIARMVLQLQQECGPHGVTRLTNEAADALEAIARERDEWSRVIVRVVEANPGFDWRDYDDGIEPDQAAQFLIEDMAEAWRASESVESNKAELRRTISDLYIERDQAIARAEAAEARLAEVEAERDKALAEMRKAVDQVSVLAGDWQKMHDTQCADRARIDALEEGMKDIAGSAAVLVAHSRVCVELHHHHDVVEKGLPGWLADCQADVRRAHALAAPAPPSSK